MTNMQLLDVPLTIETDCSDLGDAANVSRQVREAVLAAAQHCGFTSGTIGVLITDDETIHQINLQHLAHDFPTDVISFAYDQQSPCVEGELVVSVDTARREAAELGCNAIDELLLYVVHGTLHICGLDDQTSEARKQMRIAEQAVLTSLATTPACVNHS